MSIATVAARATIRETLEPAKKLMAKTWNKVHCRTYALVRKHSLKLDFFQTPIDSTSVDKGLVSADDHPVCSPKGKNLEHQNFVSKLFLISQ